MAKDWEKVIKLENAEMTQHFGRILGQHLEAGSVILLLGDLGAGKTTLVQGLGEGLGIAEAIVSPTFALIHEYFEGRIPLYHFDLYRLQPSEVEGLYPENYWEAIEVPPGITAIEWAQRLPYLPSTYLEIQLTHASEEGRRISLKSVGNVDEGIIQHLNHAELI